MAVEAAREADVAEDDVGMEAARLFDPRGAVEGHLRLVPGELQQHREALGGVDVVLDHQTAAGPFRHRGGRVFGHGSLLRSGRQRQPHQDLRPPARPGALGRHRTAVQLDQGLDQGEAEPEPAPAAVRAALGLAERLEGAVDQLRLHADAGVAHGHGRGAARRLPPHGHGDPPPRLGELAGVVQHVAHRLGDPRGIAVDPERPAGQVELDREAGRFQVLPLVLDGGAHRLGEVEPLAPEQDLPPRDAGDVQQVVHQAGEMEHLPVDGEQGPLGLIPGQPGRAQDVQAVADGGERIAQLVAEHGEELVLAAVALAELVGLAPQRLLRPFARGDVAVDPGGSDHPAAGVADRREGQGNVDPLAVLVHADRLERLDLDPLPELLEHRRHQRPLVRGDDQVQRAADRLAGRVAVDPLRPGVPARDDPVERLADDAVLRRVDDGGQPLALLLRPLEPRDVEIGEDDAVDHVLHRPIGEDPLQVPGVPVLAPHLPLARGERAQHLADVLHQVAAREAGDDVGDRPAEVAVDQPEDLDGGGGELLDPQLAVDEDGGDAGALEEVLEVAVGAVELFQLFLQLGVDRLQLLVDRLQLLLGGLELLVGRLQLLVHRQELLVGGDQLLVRALQLFQGRLEVVLGGPQLGLQPADDRIVGDDRPWLDLRLRVPRRDHHVLEYDHEQP